MVRIIWLIHFDLECIIFGQLRGCHWLRFSHSQENTVIIVFYVLLNFLFFSFIWIILRLRVIMLRFLNFFCIRSVNIGHILLEVRWVVQFWIVFGRYLLSFFLLLFFCIKMRIIFFEILRKVAISQLGHFSFRSIQLIFLNFLISFDFWFLPKSAHI